MASKGCVSLRNSDVTKSKTNAGVCLVSCDCFASSVQLARAADVVPCVAHTRITTTAALPFPRINLAARLTPLPPDRLGKLCCLDTSHRLDLFFALLTARRLLRLLFIGLPSR